MMKENKSQKMDSPQTDLLTGQMLLECEAMARYAFSSGRKVPATLMRSLESFRMLFSRDKPNPQPEVDNVSNEKAEYLRQMESLAFVHNRLAKIVAPAKPYSILLTSTPSDKKDFWKFMGPIPLVRVMMCTAVFSAIAFVAIGLTTYINASPATGDIFNSSGLELLLNQLFFIAAAGIGASFSALFRANKYIVEGSYDPKYESSYWIRFILGLIAGLILADLIPVESENSLYAMTKPLLALLGGFSSSVVYRVLNRFVGAVEALVSGDIQDMLAVQNQKMEARHAEEDVQNKISLAASLIKLQRQIGGDADPEEIKKQLDKMLNDCFFLENEPNPTAVDGTLEK